MVAACCEFFAGWTVALGRERDYRKTIDEHLTPARTRSRPDVSNPEFQHLSGVNAPVAMPHFTTPTEDEHAVDRWTACYDRLGGPVLGWPTDNTDGADRYAARDEQKAIALAVSLQGVIACPGILPQGLSVATAGRIARARSGLNVWTTVTAQVME